MKGQKLVLYKSAYEQFTYLIYIAQTEQEHIGVYPILLQGTQMVAVYLFMSLGTTGTRTTMAHGYKVFPDVFGSYSAYIKHA